MVRHMDLTSRRKRATSLVELLVVIVILLVGILAVVQVFPRGLQLIAVERAKTMMVNMTRSEIERIRNHSDQLPDMILPVTYVWTGSDVQIQADSTLSPNEIGPFGNRIDANGNVLDVGGNNIGGVHYLAGPNRVRRVIGEGGPIPAPRVIGANYGSLMSLQFAPIVYNPAYQKFFLVYGNDLTRRWGAPGGGRVRPYQYFVEDAGEPTATLYLPLGTAARNYKLNMTAYVDNGTALERREIIDIVIPVPSGTGYASFTLDNPVWIGAGTFRGCEFDTVRVARIFDEVGGFSTGNTDDDAYQYMLLDPSLGLVMFNPAGHKYMEMRGSRRVPLQAKVNYDVFDWRILKEEFRISDQSPAEHRLKLTNLLHTNSQGPDNRLHQGMGVFVDDEIAGVENRDFILMDLSTGGIFSKQSVNVDYSGGMVEIKDFDNNPSNGIQARLKYPGAATAVTVDASGRLVRAFYQGTGEWAVQVTKAASLYRQNVGTPGAGQYYPGGSAQFFLGAPYAAGESPTRIYFPAMDAGKKVTIGELYYDVAGGGEPRKIMDQDFLVSNSPIDTAVGLPYIDIRTIAPDALSINYARYGYGVRNVQGSSLTVKAFWNPAFYTLSPDEPTNLDQFEKWGRNWRRVQTETMMRKETGL